MNKKLTSISRHDFISLGRHTYNYENQITEPEKQELCIFHYKESIEMRYNLYKDV